MPEFDETEDVATTDNPEELETESVDNSEVNEELDNKYNEYLENDQAKEFEYNKHSECEEQEQLEAARIKCRNEDLEGKEHPETGVPFQKRTIEIEGKEYEVVAPEFQSSYDAQLPENLYMETDRKQFKECNNQLKQEVTNNQEFRDKFSPEELEQIENGDTPDGYTWHHDVDEGKMQLVSTETHAKTGHTGGRAFWGGGTESR